MSAARDARRATRAFGLRCAASLGLLAVLWGTAGGAAIVQTLLQVSPLWGLAAVATLVAQTALSAQRWRITAAQLGHILPWRYAVKEYFLSQAVNQALPGAVMGDAARALRARARDGLRVAMQAVVFERLAGQIAMFLTLGVAFLSTLFVAGGVDWPPVLRVTIATALAVVAICAAVGFALRNVLRPALSVWVGPMTAALFAPRVLPAQIGFGLAITACNLAAFGFAARAVGVELSVVEIAALVPVVLFAMLVPLTVSGWGLREGAAALVLPIAGVSTADSIAASITFGVALLVSVLPGALVGVLR